MTSLFIGVDPGMSGAVCAIDEKGWVHTILKWDSIQEQHEAIEASCWVDDRLVMERRCYLEKVHAMPRQGVSSMFKFGEYFGAAQASIFALEIPVELVTPQRWQKRCGVTGKFESTTLRKRAHLVAAKALFPAFSDKIRLGNCDAALLAWACWKESCAAPKVW